MECCDEHSSWRVQRMCCCCWCYSSHILFQLFSESVPICLHMHLFKDTCLVLWPHNLDASVMVLTVYCWCNCCSDDQVWVITLLPVERCKLDLVILVRSLGDVAVEVACNNLWFAVFQRDMWWLLNGGYYNTVTFNCQHFDVVSICRRGSYHYISSCECNKVVTNILAKLSFSVIMKI